jgi:hypothetical protein
VVSAVFASSDPRKPSQKEDARPASSAPERERGVRNESEGRDRGVRGSIASAPWEENAHARVQGREAVGAGPVLIVDPPKRSRTS